MLKLISFIVILLEFKYNDAIHQTECTIGMACVECDSTVEKFNNGYSEAKIPYESILVKEFNRYRNDLATTNNISNMNYLIWMNGYHNLMKNMTLDVGEENVTCIDRLTGDGSHFSIAHSIVSGNKSSSDKELRNNLNLLIVSLLNSNSSIPKHFDTSRIGCFYGVKTLVDNKPIYYLKCLFFNDLFINSRQITGPACTNCATDNQCSENYKALCVSKLYSEPNYNGGNIINIKPVEFYVINFFLLLVISLKLEF